MTKIAAAVKLSCALAIGIGLGVSSPSLAASPEYVMKLTHVLNPGSPRDKLMHAYADGLEKRTNGRIKATVYPSGQLGDNRQIIEGLQLGTIQATINPTAFMGGFEPLLTVFDLPFLFPSLEASYAVSNGPAGQDLMKIVEAKGIKGLAFYCEGAKNFATTFPVHTLSDLKGKKLRSIPSPVLLSQFRAWGANPVPISFPETYNAISQGVVSGQEQEWGILRDLKFYEVSKYLTESEHGYFIDFFFVSKKWYDALPKDLQKAVVDEAQVLVPMALKMHQDYNLDAINEMRNKDHVVFYKMTAAEKDGLRKASSATYEQFTKALGSNGEKYLKEMQTEVATFEKKNNKN